MWVFRHSAAHGFLGLETALAGYDVGQGFDIRVFSGGLFITSVGIGLGSPRSSAIACAMSVPVQRRKRKMSFKADNGQATAGLAPGSG
jgi:hypothetical protein